ncbi:MAG: hypothetical protein JW891_07140 [Candidatus Lokiarchaeota archaeon]|nr:hypothetical protein [Candidatus Lokiarchaeota archaeon]
MWDVVAISYKTGFSFLFFILAILAVIVARKGYASKNIYGGTSTLICGILFGFFGIYNLVHAILPYPFNGFMVWWVGIICLIYMLYALLINKTIKKIELEQSRDYEFDSNKLSRLKRYIVLIRKENPYQKKISLKMEAIRKSFHSTGLLVLIAYYGLLFIPPLTQMVNEGLITYITQVGAFYSSLWGDIGLYPYVPGDFNAVIDLTMFALIAALFFMMLSDLIRILWGPEYSIFSLLTKSVLRNKEFNAFGPQIHLICGSIFSYLLYMMGLIPATLAFSAITVSCFSDALAALIGRKYGRHQITCIGGDVKSIEGFIAGAGSAFLFALFFVGPFYALLVALIFFLLDYFPIVIADNILNPIAISIVLGLVSVFIPIPIGF